MWGLGDSNVTVWERYGLEDFLEQSTCLGEKLLIILVLLAYYITHVL